MQCSVMVPAFFAKRPSCLWSLNEGVCLLSPEPLRASPSIKEQEKNQKSFPESLAFGLVLTKEKIEASGKILEREMSL